MDASPGLTIVLIQDPLWKTTLRAMEFTIGVMVAFTKGFGVTTKWKGRVFSAGLMAAATKDNISTTRKKDAALSCGLMAASTRANGKMENKTASARTLPNQERLA